MMTTTLDKQKYEWLNAHTSIVRMRISQKTCIISPFLFFTISSLLNIISIDEHNSKNRLTLVSSK